MQSPTKNKITQGRHGTYNAVDYSARTDPTIYAPEDGKITAYGASGTCGNRLELTAGSNRHGFCHLERPLVSVGQRVTRGQKIGVMGYTGYTIPSGPNGRHLHWVINRNGIYVYPPSLVNQTPTQGGQIMDTDAKVGAQYYTLRGNNGTAAERKSWIGQSYEKFNSVAKAEVNSRTAGISNLKSAVATLTQERDKARTAVSTLTTEVLGLRDEVKVLEALNKTQGAEIEGLIETAKIQEELCQVQLEEYKVVIETKDDEITRLTKELSLCEGTPLTPFQHLIAFFKGIIDIINPRKGN